MEYPNSGNLMRTKEKRNPSSPDMFGSIKVDKHLLLSLIEDSNGGLIELSLAGWSKTSAAGNKYLSLSVSKPKTSSAPISKPQEEDEDIPF